MFPADSIGGRHARAYWRGRPLSFSLDRPRPAEPRRRAGRLPAGMGRRRLAPEPKPRGPSPAARSRARRAHRRSAARPLARMVSRWAPPRVYEQGWRRGSAFRGEPRRRRDEAAELDPGRRRHPDLVPRRKPGCVHRHRHVGSGSGGGRPAASGEQRAGPPGADRANRAPARLQTRRFGFRRWQVSPPLCGAGGWR